MEACKPLDGPASASRRAAFLRAVASVAGDGSELDSADNGDLGSELERGAASWWKSGCGIEKGLCMPLAEPMLLCE